MPACEIGRCDGGDDGTLLEQKGLDEGSQNTVSMSSGVGAVLERTVANNHMRPNGALGVVVVRGNARDVEEREDLIFVF